MSPHLRLWFLLWTLVDCINQELGNSALTERCKGFEDAIAASGGSVEFIDDVHVPEDNAEKVLLNIQQAVGQYEKGDGWEGVGTDDDVGISKRRQQRRCCIYRTVAQQ